MIAEDKKTILMVDDERSFLLSAKEGIESFSDQFSILTAYNGQEALGYLESSDIDLVVTDLKMPVLDGFELLARMSADHQQVPVIAMTAFGTPEIHQRVQQLGAMSYLEKPIGINDLRDRIIDVFSEKSKSYIHGFSLANFLQLVESEEKTMTLRVRSGDNIGRLYIDAGDLVDAETGNLTGKEAAIAIINWEKTEIEILEGICRKTGSIDGSMMQILLEATRLADELNFGEDDTDREFEEAVRLAEGHHYKEAQKKFAAYLKKNPGNAMAWFWYSRTTGSMKHIENALKNARKLAPGDLQIVEENRKLTIAQRKLEGGQVARCPFCWSPVKDKSSQCFYCRGYFFVNKKALSDEMAGNQTQFEVSARRYKRAVDNEENPKVRYYLAMTYFNMRLWEEALDQLDTVVRQVPDDLYYSDQLDRFLSFMAEAGIETTRRDPVSSDDAVCVPNTLDPAIGKKVLVVEDSSTTRKVITITLNKEGYEVIEARDGIEAVNTLSEMRPDLILLDIILPKMDGYKVLAIIKESPDLRKIPVIMLTSRDGLLNRVKGKMAGSTAYLTKPFKPQKLVETIDKVLC